MFPSVDLTFFTLRMSQKALCPGHRVLRELLCKLPHPCSKLSKACQASGYIVLSIFASSSIQTFGNSAGELLSFLGNRVSGMGFTSICGCYSLNHLSLKMRRCCRIYNLSVNEYFIKIGTDIWYSKNTKNTLTYWNDKDTDWFSNIFSSLSSESTLSFSSYSHVSSRELMFLLSSSPGI